MFVCKGVWELSPQATKEVAQHMLRVCVVEVLALPAETLVIGRRCPYRGEGMWQSFSPL